MTPEDFLAGLANLMPPDVVLHSSPKGLALFRAAMGRGWTPETFARRALSGSLAGLSNPAGVVMVRMRELANGYAPGCAPVRAGVDWMGPWCGLCDDPRTRFVTVDGVDGLDRVAHCPRCWAQKPGTPPTTGPCTRCGTWTGATAVHSHVLLCPRCTGSQGGSSGTGHRVIVGEIEP